MNTLYRFFIRNQPRRLALILFLFIHLQKSFSQEKTHSFFEYRPEKANRWEILSFDSEQHIITYSYAKHPEGYVLRIIGSKNVNGKAALIVAIPKIEKEYFLYLNNTYEQLTFECADGSYKKTFTLGYEGPVNGIGTYCEQCANEPTEAYELFLTFFQD
ncbi:MAG: hypothetical protein K1X55_09265 [Chitinophagales bacterium]|nr:hypothetical protein [Chitinophagales bacterium]